MRARAVIGASYGDEGKGLVTDYLCSQGAQVVVRFNGGAQAGHTVVTPEGQRHVFSHFGSGTLLGVPTYLSHFFVMNPILFFEERAKLRKLKLLPQVFAHPDCLVTTYADMMINQAREAKLGDKRHGSVGVGFNETIQRSNLAHLKITMADLWNDNAGVRSKLSEICDKYARFREVNKIDVPGADDHFLRACEMMADCVHPAGMDQISDPVFEGAQGLLLDRDYKPGFPHLTNSNTGMKNVRILCAQAGITDIEPYYVSRTYLTRHGAGVLPGEDPDLEYEDNTNTPHPWQGALRFARLDDNVRTRCADDAQGNFQLVLTHCDQAPPRWDADLYSYGPTRNDITSRRR